MHRTEKLRPVTVADQGRANAPLFVVAALLAMGVAYLLLLAQPGLVHSLRGLWLRIPGSSGAPAWALPAVAAGVAIGGAALGVAVLSAFVRGVQVHPYAWLAPVLVGFSILVMSGMPIALPWPALSLRTFSVLAGLTVLGGGAVMQMRGGASKAAGVLLMLLPFVTLMAGYAATSGGLAATLSQLDASGQLYLFVLGLTSLGIGFMALVSKRSSDEAAALAHHMRDQRSYAAEAHERVRISEAHAAQLERRAQGAEQQLRAMQAAGPRAGSAAISDAEAAEFAALAKPGISRSAVVALALVALCAATAGGYFGLYRPLERRTAAQHALFSERAKEHAAEIDALREHFEAQQASVRQLLAAEKVKSAEALAAVEQARAEAKTAEPESVEPARGQAVQRAAPGKPAKAAARARRAAARRAAAVQRARAKPEPVAAGTTERSSKLEASTRGALRGSESIDDDPIGGLDGM